MEEYPMLEGKLQSQMSIDHSASFFLTPYHHDKSRLSTLNSHSGLRLQDERAITDLLSLAVGVIIDITPMLWPEVECYGPKLESTVFVDCILVLFAFVKSAYKVFDNLLKRRLAQGSW